MLDLGGSTLVAPIEKHHLSLVSLHPFIKIERFWLEFVIETKICVLRAHL